MNLPFPKIGEPTIRHILKSKLFLEQWVIPSGTEVRLYQGQNHGIIALPENCVDARGFSIPKRLFRL